MKKLLTFRIIATMATITFICVATAVMIRPLNPAKGVVIGALWLASLLVLLTLDRIKAERRGS